MILVTGGTGLVGSHVLRLLLKAGHKVRGTYRKASSFELVNDIKNEVEWTLCDLNNIDEVQDAFEGVERVVHCAAVVSFEGNKKRQMFKVNIEGTSNVVNEALERGVQKFIHVSSIAAIGGLSKDQVDENEKWDPNDMHSAYGESKYQSELEVWRAIEEDLDACIVNPSVILGEGNYQRSSSELFGYAVSKGSKVIDSSINVVDVRDVAKAIEKLLFSSITAQRFILNAEKVSYMDLFSWIRESVGLPQPQKVIAKKQLNWLMIMDLIRSIFTFSPRKLTKEMLHSLTKESYYVGESITKTLDFEYTPIRETVNWSCSSLVDKKG